MTRACAIVAVLGAALFSGCSYTGTAKDFDPGELGRDPGWIVARDVPLIRQEAGKDCGAAAMAMTLASWKTESSAAEIVGTCQPDPEHGIKAGALRDYAIKKGFQAFLFEGRMDDFERELRQRRPVIVGLVKPNFQGAVAHYEVVVAIHPVLGIIVTLDPARGWRRNSFEGFKTEWEPAKRLTLVVIGKPPSRTGSD